ncbi:MAG: hypothetical protein ACJ8LN_10905, partial [Sulfurifustis sp.]
EFRESARMRGAMGQPPTSKFLILTNTPEGRSDTSRYQARARHPWRYYVASLNPGPHIRVRALGGADAR